MRDLFARFARSSREGTRLLPVLVVSTMLLVPPVLAQPSNDSQLTPTLIPALPFSDTVAGVDAATSAPQDPELFCAGGRVTRGFHTVWYRYIASSHPAAADRYVTVAALGGGDSIVQVFEDNGSEIAGIPGACNDDSVAAGGAGRIDGLPLERGRTYLIEVGYFDPAPPGTTLQFSMTSTPIYTVTKNADTADGQCDGDCSLREAVLAAGATGGAIELAAGEYPLTIPGPNERDGFTGDLNIGISRRGVSIIGLQVDGKRPVIRQTVQDRVIEDESRSTLILRDLVITGGSAATDGFGGGISRILGHLGAERIEVAGNTANVDGAGIHGSLTSMWLRDSLISGNSAGRDGGGLAYERRGASAQIRIERTAFVNNSALDGAGLLLWKGCTSTCAPAPSVAVLMENVTVSSNAAASGGAAVLLRGFGNSRADLRHLTVVDNQAAGLALTGVTNAAVVLERSALGRNVAASGATDCLTDGASSFVVRFNTAETPGNCPWPAADNDVVADVGLQALTTDVDGSYHLPVVTGPLVDRDAAEGCAATDQRDVARPITLLDPTMPCDRGAIEAGQPELLFRNGFE